MKVFSSASEYECNSCEGVRARDLRLPGSFLTGAFLLPSPPSSPSPSSSSPPSSPTIEFAIFALRDLKAQEEVVLGWEWDDGSVVHELPALVKVLAEGGVDAGSPKDEEGARVSCVIDYLST